MKKTYLFILVILIFSISYAETGSSISLTGDTTDINESDWSGVVAIRVGEYFCTGTLITENIVLTAAHCIYDKDKNGKVIVDVRNSPEKIEIIAGSNIIVKRTFLSKVKEVIVNSKWTTKVYENDYSNDIALIKLTKNITDRELYRINNLDSPPEQIQGVLVGFGATENSFEVGIKREGKSKIKNKVFDLMHIGNPAGTCGGDSGGPFFLHLDNQWIVAGVTSFGATDVCDPERDNYDTNVYSHREWIEQKVFELSGVDITNYSKYQEIDSNAKFETNNSELSDSLNNSGDGGCSLSLL